MRHHVQYTLMWIFCLRTYYVNVYLYLVSRTYRLAAYRQFTQWIHSRLGRAVRRVIPACAVIKIRNTFPELSGEYTGFTDTESSSAVAIAWPW